MSGVNAASLLSHSFVDLLTVAFGTTEIFKDSQPHLLGSAMKGRGRGNRFSWGNITSASLTL